MPINSNDLSSYYSDYFGLLHLSRLDPCILLSFLCLSLHDFVDFKRQLEIINQRFKPVIQLVDYNEDVERESWDGEDDDF